MFKRGTVVQHKVNPWIGVVTLDGPDGLIIKWMEGRMGGGVVNRTLVTPINGYEFEAALALGDTEAVLKLYRAEQERNAVLTRLINVAFATFIIDLATGVKHRPTEALIVLRRRAVEAGIMLAKNAGQIGIRLKSSLTGEYDPETDRFTSGDSSRTTDEVMHELLRDGNAAE